MLLRSGSLPLMFLFLLQSNHGYCSSDDFQSDVDGFIDAFDEAYSTEVISPTTYETVEKNDIPFEASFIAEETAKQNQEPVQEETFMTEKLFSPGSDVKHELTEEVKSMADRAIASISSQLKVVSVTEAISTVTNKVERSLWLVVARQPCEMAFCEISCRVDLVSLDSGDEVTWQNCLDSSSSNEVVRDKRGAIGGFKQVDEVEAKELAEIAIQTLDSIDPDDTKRVVTQVIRAQKQLVNGIMYHLTLEMASSNCKEEEQKCEGKLSDHNICKILMQRLFSGEAPHNAQVIKSECTPISKAKDFDMKKRVQRHVVTEGVENNVILDHVSKTKPYSGQALGGKRMEDPHSDKIREISRFALGELDRISISPNKQKILSITDARSHDVGGIKYFLQMIVAETNCKKGSNKENCHPNDQTLRSCDVVVLEKKWGNSQAMTDVQCTPFQRRSKRAVLPGGLKPADVNDAKVKEMAAFAINELDRKSNSLNSNKLLVISKAETQVVAGTNYYLKVQMVETNCLKGSTVNQECTAASGKVIQECDVVIYDRPWDKHREMTSAKCSPAPDSKTVQKREVLLGGRTPADVNDAKVKEMASFAVAQLDGRSNSLNTNKLIAVKKAETQVVAGANYYLTLQMVETNCRKGTNSDNQDCSAASGKVIQECDVVIYDRPWEKHREMTSAKCSPAPDSKTVQKRGVLVGGRTPADVNDAKVKEMASFAVAQLDGRSNSLNTNKLVAVKKAETQVVAGANYYLTLQMVETNCRKGANSDNQDCSAASGKVIQECDVVIYDRPWDKHREMTSAKCSPAPESKKVQKRGVLVGGRTPADVNDARVKEMATFAVAQLDGRSNSLNANKLITVKKAETQVVAGANYFLTLQMVETNCRKGTNSDNQDCSAASGKVIQECDVVIYDRPWDKHREMTSAKCSPAPESKNIQKRDVFLGGLSPSSKDSQEVQEMAQFAVQDLNKKSNSLFKQVLVEVISSHTQVVAGMNYHLKLRIAESDCKKNDEGKSDVCSPKENGVYQECDVIVWSQPWLNKQQVTKSSCKPTQTRQVATGEPRPVDSWGPDVLQAAKFSLAAINRASNSMYKHALVRVVDAKVQTVSGKKYFLTLEVGESECTKNQVEEDCSLREQNTLNEKCNVVVWDRPWLSKREVLNVECGLRRKRSIPSSLEYEVTLQMELFEAFKSKYNKVYSDEAEHQKRFRIFRANLKKIEALQANEQGTATYGPNMFADLSAKEFKHKYLGLKPGPGPKPSKHHMVPAEVPDVTLPLEFDWRDHNAVTPVKNQGQCGSCWAFSVTGNVEGQWAIKHSKLISLSEQELVDCDKSDSGCNGGYMTVAYEAIEKLGGLETEEQYPYDAEDETCKFNKIDAQVTVVSSVNITSNETEMAQWLVNNGPISIGINANAMQFYMGGVSHPFKFLCSKDNLDHGVLLVGFGVHRTSIRHKLLPYWLVKNSWGPHWGEKGYYRVYRGDGTCGVNQMASSAVVG